VGGQNLALPPPFPCCCGARFGSCAICFCLRQCELPLLLPRPLALAARAASAHARLPLPPPPPANGVLHELPLQALSRPTFACCRVARLPAARTPRPPTSNHPRAGMAKRIPLQLLLAIGALMKLASNLHPEWGLFNGARCTVVGWLFQDPGDTSGLPAVVVVDVPGARPRAAAAGRRRARAGASAVAADLDPTHPDRAAVRLQVRGLWRRATPLAVLRASPPPSPETRLSIRIPRGCALTRWLVRLLADVAGTQGLQPRGLPAGCRQGDDHLWHAGAGGGAGLDARADGRDVRPRRREVGAGRGGAGAFVVMPLLCSGNSPAVCVCVCVRVCVGYSVWGITIRLLWTAQAGWPSAGVLRRGRSSELGTLPAGRPLAKSLRESHRRKRPAGSHRSGQQSRGAAELRLPRSRPGVLPGPARCLPCIVCPDCRRARRPRRMSPSVLGHAPNTLA
jgi:hypothetical protein